MKIYQIQEIVKRDGREENEGYYGKYFQYEFCIKDLYSGWNFIENNIENVDLSELTKLGEV